MSPKSFLVLKLLKYGDLGVEMMLWVFFFLAAAVYWEKLFLSQGGGSVSSRGSVSAIFKVKLLLQPLEGLLWPHSMELALGYHHSCIISAHSPGAVS